MGAARDCYECALEYSKNRIQFEKPIASFQLTQQKLVDMMVEINKGMLLALRLGRMKDDGRLRTEQISLGKLNNVRDAIKIAREARTILGGNGVTLECPVIRHANNLESVLTYEGTSEVHTLILGQAITGMPAFRWPFLGDAGCPMYERLVARNPPMANISISHIPQTGWNEEKGSSKPL